MLTLLIPMIAKIVVSTSAGVAIDSVVKMIVPVGIAALPGFGIKIGTAIASGIIGVKVGNLVETNVQGIIAELTDAQEESTSEDN